MVAFEPRPRVQMQLRGPSVRLFQWDAEGTMPDEVLLDGPAGCAKTWNLWNYLLWRGRRYPGSRHLICRSTRVSLTNSALVTLEKILGRSHPMLAGASRGHRESYWLGKSEYVLGSLENPDPYFGTEWDTIWVVEAREIDKNTWETLGSRLRNEMAPNPVLLGDTNPAQKSHWLNKRCDAGLTHRLRIRHVDNPAYWDPVKRTWTAAGRRYLMRLARLTGVRRRRLYLGQWCNADGAVWPDFDMLVHGITLRRGKDGAVTEDQLRELDIRGFYGGFDWGYDAPGCLQVWALAGNRKRYRIAEVYQRNQQTDWWAGHLAELHKLYPLEEVHCDPSRPDVIDAFNDRLGARREGPGAIAVKALNAIDQGCDVVRRLMSRVEGGPLLYFDRNALVGGRDMDLVEASLPWCTEEEIDGYVFDRTDTEDGGLDEKVPKDKPKKGIPNHGCDTMRYANMGMEYVTPGALRVRQYPVNSLGAMLNHAAVFDPDARAEETPDLLDPFAVDSGDFYGQ